MKSKKVFLNISHNSEVFAVSQRIPIVIAGLMYIFVNFHVHSGTGVDSKQNLRLAEVRHQAHNCTLHYDSPNRCNKAKQGIILSCIRANR